MEDPQPYHVVTDADEYQVIDPNDRVIMTCRDNRSAEHYAALLSHAYRQGYRSGYRDSKTPRD